MSKIVFKKIDKFYGSYPIAAFYYDSYLLVIYFSAGHVY